MNLKKKNVELTKKIFNMEQLQSIEVPLEERTRARLSAMILSDALDRKYSIRTLTEKKKVVVTRHW